jgi:ubiquinone biosynthesis protein UbiJ
LNQIPKSITTIIEASINQYLGLDPAAGSNLQVLENSVLEVTLKEFQVPLYFQIIDKKINVRSSYEDEPDTRMTASIFTLFKMTLAKQNDEALLGADIEMSGDMDVGRQFRNIFKNIDIDWEEILSKYTGDIVAHKLGNGARLFSDWISNTNEILKKDVTEYLQEESKQLPSKEEVSDYIDAVDKVRLAVERVEARMRQLQSITTTSDIHSVGRDL